MMRDAPAGSYTFTALAKHDEGLFTFTVRPGTTLGDAVLHALTRVLKIDLWYQRVHPGSVTSVQTVYRR